MCYWTTEIGLLLFLLLLDCLSYLARQLSHSGNPPWSTQRIYYTTKYFCLCSYYFERACWTSAVSLGWVTRQHRWWLSTLFCLTPPLSRHQKVCRCWSDPWDSSLSNLDCQYRTERSDHTHLWTVISRSCPESWSLYSMSSHLLSCWRWWCASTDLLCSHRPVVSFLPFVWALPRWVSSFDYSCSLAHW